MKFIYFHLNSEKNNIDQSWVLLYGTKHDVG